MANLSALTNSTVPKLEVRPYSPATAYLTKGLLFSGIDAEHENDPMGALPAYGFYIRHPIKNISLLWDLSISKDLEAYPTKIRELYPTMKPVVKSDFATFLPTKGVAVSSINHIILSHVHFDHIGDVSTFPTAEVIVGRGTQASVRPAYPINPDSSFSESTFPEGRTRELTDADFSGVKKTSTRSGGVGPWDASQVYDFFGDGSFLILDAPGHMAGHQIGLVRAEKGWVLLGGDSCHHECQQWGYRTGEMGWAMHEKPEVAKENLGKIEKLREAAEEEGVKLTFAAAHVNWFEEWKKF